MRVALEQLNVQPYREYPFEAQTNSRPTVVQPRWPKLQMVNELQWLAGSISLNQPHFAVAITIE